MSTLAHLLAERALATPARVALRHHRLGIWDATTWQELHEGAARAGAGLLSMDVAPGEVVALLAANQPRWITADLAIQGAGAVSLAIDPDTSPATVCRLLAEAGAVVAVVGDQEQYDKVVESRAALPGLRAVVVMETRGIRELEVDDRSDGDRVLTFAQLEQRGKDGEGWVATARSLDPSQPCAVEVVAEADGPALVTRSHAELLDAARRVHGELGVHSGDELYLQLSFADPVARSLAVAGLLAQGYEIDIGQGGRVVFFEMQAAQPTLVHADARWLAQLAGDVRQRTASTSGIKRLALRRGLRPVAPPTRPAGPRLPATRVVGAVLVVAELAWLLLTPDLGDPLRLFVCAVLALVAGAVLVLGGLSVQGPLRRRYGLSRARAVCVRGTAPDDATQVLGALGVPLVAVDAPVWARARTPEEAR